MNETFEEIRKLIDLSDSIAISGHISPDGDAIGSCAALAMALKIMGKDVKVILDEYPEVFSIIPTGGIFVKEAEEDYLPDLYIALDSGDKERLGKNADLFDKTLHTVNIDHHVSNTLYGKVNYIDEEASSTSEIIFQFLYGYAPIDNDIAAAVYAGIIFDTGGFRHPSTTPVTMAIVSELLEYDFNFTSIYNSIFHSRKFTEAKAMGKALINLESHFDDRCVTSYITLKEMQEHGLAIDEVSEVSSYIKGISGSVVSVFFHEKENNVFKVSMRSEPPFNVCAIAQSFGGGGHKQAAGCSVQGCLEDVFKKVIEEVEKQLRG